MTAVAPLPPAPVDELSRPFWEAVEKGHLVFQCCRACANAWLPARSECPACLSADTDWRPASGNARLVSWVVYHRAFNASFADRLPYTVAIAELEEGPRMITNIVGVDDPEHLSVDQPLTLKIERDGGVAVPRFVPRNGV
ncbi:OB-fold domain-containing protein [Mesorhizobium sp. CAU 1741]|uniref:Zn-ribbon domain-containing OB-fold protein n=1 Tax=Mesorhizobium sp. CAU 1741 TaxID=3140366 RepID=UPI00325AB60F